MKKIYSYLLILVSSSECFGAQDYNGNRLSPSKIIFNNNTQNSYIQSAMQKTVNFDGLIDQTFGNLGSTYLNAIGSASTNDQCNSIALQADGKIVMGGYTYLNGTSYRFAAARLTNDGSPDTSFGNNGLVYLNAIAPGSDSDGCNSIAIQPDGKIVMGGYTYLNGTDYRFAAVRLNADGSIDTTFGNNGSLYITAIALGSDYDVCYSIALQADGKIVMGGLTFFNNTGYRFAAARLNTNGSLDTSFGNNGSMYLDAIATNSTYDGCQSIAVRANGKLVMGGVTNLNNVNYRFSAAQLNANGSLDTTFGNNGSICLDVIAPLSEDDGCESIAVQADGKIVMGGHTRLNNIYDVFAAARLTTNGSPDVTFGANGSIYLNQIFAGNDQCNSIALQPDGKIVMGGVANDDGKDHFAAARLINPMTLQSYQTSYAVVGAGIYS